ncbi:MAG: sigma 54-interacting transcriptional regulator [Clostridia bacterium]|nr:sigma 54-interacting transcriptional regulator [Clostridia bacterium]
MNYQDTMEILSQCNMGAVIVTDSWEIRYVNEAAIHLLHGPENGWLIGKKLSNIAAPLCQESEQNVYAHIAFEEYLLRCPTPDVDDLPEETQMVVFRNASREAHCDMYNNILEQITESVILCDRDSRIVFLNNAAMNMDGLALDDVKGERIEKVYEALDGGGLIVPRAIETRQSFRERRQYYTTRYKKNVDITANTFPVVQNGQVLGAYSLMQDWSMVDNLHKKIVELQDKLTVQTASGRQTGKSALSAKYRFDDIVHISSTISDIVERCKQAAKSDSSVMFYGETGTGKELFAQSVHNASSRADGPFLAINCAAIPENLLESLLFGTEKGAYTGAERRPGLFEQANNGTLLLDELNSMNINLQAKLLRVLQDGMVRRVGGSSEIHVNVRVLSNINIPPYQAIAENKLRQDLFYRLGVVNFTIPPLRERKEDISVLTKYFIMHCNGKLSRNVRNIDEATLEQFYAYSWPGNIRELEHAIEHAINVLPDDESVITPEYLPQNIREAVSEKNMSSVQDITPVLGGSLNNTIKDVERKTICRILRENGGNISESARILNMSRQSLQYRLRKYKIDVHGLK